MTIHGGNVSVTGTVMVDHRYPIFPEFETLTIADRGRFESLTSNYPQYSDICLSSLLIWWGFSRPAEFSTLNGNVVLRYELPGDPDNSGLCLVGTNDVDGCMDLVLNHLEATGEPARLVHVPAFTVDCMNNVEADLNVAEERDWAEYVIDTEMLACLGGAEIGRIRRKVNRCSREIEGRNHSLVELDLLDGKVLDDLVALIKVWNSSNGTQNADPDEGGTASAIRNTASVSSDLGISNIALHVDGALVAIGLFSVTQDQQYLIVHHLKANYEIPFVFDYMTHLLAKAAAELQVPRINMEMDLGIESLRFHKMALRPVELLAKYTVARPSLRPTSSPASLQGSDL
jgi:hypothetical protein